MSSYRRNPHRLNDSQEALIHVNGVIVPQWVVVNGEIKRVSEFASLPPSKRPAASCPVCRRGVILKLGKVRTHHYAHDPGMECSSTQPETALHLNTKFHIYKQLLGAAELSLEHRCLSCENTGQLLWCREWDDVRVEHTTDKYRADIALLLNGSVIGAIEIFVTHKVDEEKAKFLDDKGISWIEVEARPELYEGQRPWTPEQELPYRRLHPEAVIWRCELCEQAKKQQEAEKKRREAQWEYERLNWSGEVASKLVDFYFPSGKKFREWYFVVQEVKDGKCVRAWVQDRNYRIIVSIRNIADLTEARRRVCSMLADELEERRRRGHIVDDFMDWQDWKPGNKFHASHFDRFPYRYHWDYRNNKWICHHIL